MIYDRIISANCVNDDNDLKKKLQLTGISDTIKPQLFTNSILFQKTPSFILVRRAHKKKCK